jgi:hypothetical protein
VSDNEDGLWNAMVVIGLLVLAVALAVWWYRSEYSDCMAKKNDEIICTTYVNSFLN